MDDCLFCRIVRGEIPSAKVYEDDLTYAFRDIAPQAPSHVLVVPKAHIPSVGDVERVDDATLAACLRACQRVAALEGLRGGFRVVSNCGEDACQTVKHLHFHVLGGKRLNEGMA